MRLSEKTRRRVFVYARRSARCLSGGLNRPCLFLHLPKCGGTSLANALYATIPLHRRIAVLDAVATRRAAALWAFGRDDPWLCHEDLEHGRHTMRLREQLALTHMAEGVELLHGHLLLTPRITHHLTQHFAMATLMRDPVERCWSNFQMAVRAGIVEPDIDAWLEGPLGRRHATVFLRYLSGSIDVPPADEATALVRAEDALRQIDVVGFLDALPDFVARFHRRFGVRLAIPHFNAAPSGIAASGRDAPIRPASDLSLSPTQRRKLEILCFPDLFLYAAARRSACAEIAARSDDPGREGVGPMDAALG